MIRTVLNNYGYPRKCNAVWLQTNGDTDHQTKLVDGEEDCAVFFLGDKTVFMQDHDKDIDIQVTWSNQHKGALLTAYEKY